MIKKILASAVLVGFSLSLFAQTFDFGVKGGINSYKMIPDDNTAGNPYTYSDLISDAKTGYHIGAFARFGGKRLYLQPELLYSVKKSSKTNSNLVLSYNYSNQSFDIKSVQLPILLGVKLINLKIASLRVFTGPAMSIILKDSDIKLFDSGSLVVDPTLYDSKYFKNNVWDWQAGAGIDIGNLVLDARYEWGLTNISDTNPQKISFNNKGNTFTFSIGYKFL